MAVPRFLLILTVVFCVHMAEGQQFAALPAEAVNFEVAPNLANECFIYIENQTDSALHLKWRTSFREIPAGWDIDLCDYGACYGGIPSQGQMIPVAAGQQGYLKLIVQPGLILGSGAVHFLVFDSLAPTAYIEVKFNLSSPGFVSTAQVEAPELLAFPNPFSDRLTLVAPAAAGRFLLTDALGNTAMSGWMGSDDPMELNAEALPAGIYFLHFMDKRHRVLPLIKQ